MCVAMSGHSTARPTPEDTTMSRRAPRLRSMSGPSSGDTMAKGASGEEEVEQDLVIGRVRRDGEEQRAGQRDGDQRVAAQHRRLHQREAADRMRLVEHVVHRLPSHVLELLDLGGHRHHANVRSAAPSMRTSRPHAHGQVTRAGDRATPRWPLRALRQAAVGGGPSPGSRGGIHCNSGRFNTIPSSSVTSSCGLHEAVLVEDRTQAAELVARFLLPVAAIERQHQLGPAALAQRLGLDSGVEIGHQGLVVAELQPPVEAVLLGTGVTLTQSHGNGRPLRPIGQVGNRFTAPQARARS